MKVTIKELIIESDSNFKSIRIEIEDGNIKSIKPMEQKSISTIEPNKTEPINENISSPAVPVVPVVPDISNRPELEPVIMDDEF